MAHHSSAPYSSSSHESYPTSAGHRRQKSILQACASGNVVKLTYLFQQIGVRAGDFPVEPQWLSYHNNIVPVPTTGPPPTSAMIQQAVKHSQAPTLALLLATYPCADVASESILATAFAHPDLATFELLHHRDPSIARFDYFPQYTTSLMMACQGGNPLIPAFLLDHNADPATGGADDEGALAIAIEEHQPLWLIEKIIRAGAAVDLRVLLATIRGQRFKVLAWLVERCWIDNRAEVLGQAVVAARKMEHFGMAGLLEGKLRGWPGRRSRAKRWKTGFSSSDGCGSDSSRSSSGTEARVDRIPFVNESSSW